MFTTTNVVKHDEIKAKLLGPYSGRELENMEPRYVFSTGGALRALCREMQCIR